MIKFGKLSLKRKIIFVSVFVASIVFIFAAGFLISFQTLIYRENLKNKIDSLVGIVVFHNISALQFNDSVAATQGLNSLKSDSSILYAAIFDKSGEVFAEYKKDSNSPIPAKGLFQKDHGYFSSEFYYESKTISDEDGILGSINISVDLTPYYTQLEATLSSTFFFLLLALSISLLLAWYLQGFVTKPILGLAKTSKQIADTGNYSQRAAKLSSDETGLLVDTFNQMLSQIEDRDRELSMKGEELKVALEQAQSANEAKSVFLATVSHEIRTPLNGIQGALYLVQDANLGESERYYTEVALKSCESLNIIINDVLDLSKIEAGKMVLEKRDVELLEILAETLDIQKFKANEKGIYLGSIVEKGVPEVVIGDPTRLKQILLNLVGNAIKFTNEGSVIVRYRLANVDNRSSLIVEIVDTGIGIAKNKHKLLFTSFNQADASTTRKYGGTGLGLAICKQLVELMGGRIGVESEEGMGSKFWFEIPVEIVKESNLHPEVFKSRVNLFVLGEDKRVNDALLQQFNCWDIKASTDSSFLTIGDQINLNKNHNFNILVASDLKALLELVALEVKYPIISVLQPKEVSKIKDLDTREITVEFLQSPVNPSRLFDAIMAFYGADRSKKNTVKAESNLSSASKFTESKVLIADDNEINRVVLSELLRKFGISPIIAVNGEEVIQKYKEEKFDLIFLDLHMPVMDGLEACKIIRELEAGIDSSLKVPIVALSADVTVEVKKHCEEIGMNDYVGKPLDPSRLREVLLNYLKQ